jgi:nicotinamide-nucleotide amidase
MTFSVSILATGSELLDGRVVDTNSNFVARELSELGLKLKRVLLVDDDMPELLSGLHQLSAVSDIVITSGGLGPTDDDLTRDMFARFFGVGVAEHPDARKHLEEFYGKRGRKVDATNLKQALLPIGSTMIPNAIGTAPGFMMTTKEGVTVCSLSGVPREFKSMYAASVAPLVRERSVGLPKLKRVTFKTFGLPESLVGKIVSGLKLPPEIVVSYRAAFPEVHVVLKAPESFVALGDNAERVRAAIESGFIFSQDREQLFVERVQSLLIEHGATVATAESCTGGMLGEFLTRTPGSSAVYRGGVVAYHNDIKERALGVTREVLDTYGAVSAQTVEAMATAVRNLYGATFGLAVSGVAGPDGGSEEKPVGTFYVGFASPDGVTSLPCLYPSERGNVRTYAAYVALDCVRRTLEGSPLPDTLPVLSRDVPTA